MIILTGHSGFLGTVIKKSLKSELLQTVGRKNSDITCDLAVDIPQIFDSDIIIHVAGKAHFSPLTDDEKKLFFDINLKGTENLLKGLELHGFPKKFVFISSVSVYGKDFGIGIDENTYLGAIDPYGISKVEAERIILDWCTKHHVVCTILRLPLIIGPNPPGNLKAMIKGIQKGYYFNIAGGRAKKSMVLAEDVAKCILRVAEIGGIYNLTDGYHPSFEELSNHISVQLGKGKPMNVPLWLARIIAKFGNILGNKSPLNTNKFKKITLDLTFDDTKAREAFGWNPTPVLEGFKIK